MAGPRVLGVYLLIKQQDFLLEMIEIWRRRGGDQQVSGQQSGVVVGAEAIEGRHADWRR